jgi:6,7-dimethyl-8-ribityllumazine synthase
VSRDRIAVVVSRFNEEVTYKLLLNCTNTLKANGVAADQMRVVHVPGGFEIPWAVQELALTKKYAVVIALGCILKGETPQNEHMARSTVQLLQRIGVATRVPVILGVITPNNEEQAVARTKGELDRGKESALAALDMLRLRKAIHKRSHG